METEQSMDDFKYMHENLKSQTSKRYTIAFPRKVSSIFFFIGEFVLCIIAIPFLTLIQIFKIIFNRK